MFFVIVGIFLLLVFLGVMGHISKATNIGCGYVTFYTIVWLGSLGWLIGSWHTLHGFFPTLGALIIAFLMPFLIHAGWLILKEFVVWALKGLGD